MEKQAASITVESGLRTKNKEFCLKIFPKQSFAWILTYHFSGWISKKPLVNPRSSIRPIDARPDQVSYEIAYDGEGFV